MTIQTKTTLLVALAIGAVATFAIILVPVEGNTDLTRHVSDDEFRQAQIQALDLKSKLNKLQSQGATGASDSEAKRELDFKIAQLMPILEKHQKQQFAKHYIEPARKAQMELAESNLRTGIAKLGFDSYAVNLNTLTKTIEIVTSDSTKNEQVHALIDNYASKNIPVTLENGNFTVVDGACSDQNDDCDPIMGGIEIEGG